ncbi:hypothetical protein IW262DRAFT_1468951 [Armillaria fumosa]|nr:hypothetical protein IW262DRAFT_1468951 [Armillaria fumosa]
MPSDRNEPAHVTIAPPVEIFHPVFGQCLDNINNPTFEPDEATVSAITGFMTTAAAIHTDEGNRAKILCGHLTSILRTFMGQLATNIGRSPDSMIFKALNTVSHPADYHGDQAHPGGPYLSILGVVWTDRFIVQRLTDIMWVGEATTYEDAHLYCLSQIFTSLCDCHQTLHTFYDDIKDRTDLELIPHEPHPHYFPYPDSFHKFQSCTKTEFKYLDVLESDSTNVTFLAQTMSDDPHKLIVKFVDRYGVSAHACLAADNMAPRLLFCSLLNGINDVRDAASAGGITKWSDLYVGPLGMVIMEYIDRNNAQTTPPDAWPTDAYTQIQAALVKLHSQGLIFGDLCLPNVMFTHDQKVLLIDFDWLGEEGQVHYPKGLSRGEHDMAMLDMYFTQQL